MGFTKLDDSLTRSSVWSTDPYTRCVFISLLSMCDAEGIVRDIGIPGLARINGFTIEETKRSLDILMSPDEYSKNREFDGKRVLECPESNGYRVVSYNIYRERNQSKEKSRAKYLSDYYHEKTKPKREAMKSKDEATKNTQEVAERFRKRLTDRGVPVDPNEKVKLEYDQWKKKEWS